MLFLVDTYSVLYRLFFALPELSHNGIQLNSIYGLSKLMIKLTKTYKPQYLVFCVDKGKSGRNKVIQTYKLNRKPQPNGFRQQIPVFYEFSKSAGFKVFGLENTEADDIICSLTNLFKEKLNIFILTGDKDLLQLLEKNVTVLIMRKGITEIDVYDQNTFQKKYGFSSSFYKYYKAMVGDNSDNIEGIKGIGPKKATEFIKNISSIEDFYKFLTPEQLLKFNQNLEVISLKDYSDKIDIQLEEMKIDLSWYRKKEFIDFLKKYGFVSILREVDERQMRLF